MSVHCIRQAKSYGEYDGLSCDVTYYAEQIRDQAWALNSRTIILLSRGNPIAWLWARTAICPNPACGIETVLTTSWWLSKKKGDLAWIQPRVEGGVVHLDVVPVGDKWTPESPRLGGVHRSHVSVVLGCGRGISYRPGCEGNWDFV